MKRPRVDVNLEELDQIIDRGTHAPLSESEGEKLKGALHALAGMQVDFEHIRESCLDFIDTLWTPRGSFFGHWGEDILDCEYTYYGLLALGHLSL